MATATVDTPLKDMVGTLQDKAADVLRQVADVSHEAKRAIKRGAHDIADFKDEAAIRVKREPFKAVGLAFGVGIALGAIVGFVGAKVGRCRE